jgi:hypothetical protein
MTVYVMGKAQPPELSARLKQSVSAARARQTFDASVDARSYRRVMQMAEDLLLIAHAQSETGNHSDAAVASRWLADVVAKCRAQYVQRERIDKVIEGLKPSKGRLQ